MSDIICPHDGREYMSEDCKRRVESARLRARQRRKFEYWRCAVCDPEQCQPASEPEPAPKKQYYPRKAKCNSCGKPITGKGKTGLCQSCSNKKNCLAARSELKKIRRRI